MFKFGEALNFLNCSNLQISGLSLINSPRGHVCLTECNGVTISNLHITAPEESPNTDGIDMGRSTNVQINHCNIGTGNFFFFCSFFFLLNFVLSLFTLLHSFQVASCLFVNVTIGDDCIAVSGGSSNINITGVQCGPDHGIRFVENH